MKILGNVLAVVRAIIMGLITAMMVGVYAILDFIFTLDRNSAYRLRRVWLTYCLIPIGNIKIDIQGKADTSVPSIVVSNHRSLVDMVLYNYVDALVIAKAEIADYPVINKGAEYTGVIWLKRDSFRSRANARNAISDTIMGGNNLHLFPEGTVSTKQHTLQFKKGAFDVACELNAPVVPMTIDYRDERDLWTDPSFIGQYLRIFAKWKTEVKIVIDEPMHCDGDSLAFTQKVEDLINNNLHNMQKGWSHVFPEGRDTVLV